jgi:hypothetical protein
MNQLRSIKTRLRVSTEFHLLILATQFSRVMACLTFSTGVSNAIRSEIHQGRDQELLGAPRLIRGESEEAYLKWWDAFVAAYNPERLLEWFQLYDYATKTWEQQRLQRCNSVLVETAMVKALQNLLSHLEPGRKLA